MVKSALILSSFFIFTGCVSQQDKIAADQQTCSAYGYQRGTNAFAICMQTEQQRRDAAAAATVRGFGHLRDAARQLEGPQPTQMTCTNHALGTNCTMW